MSERKLELEGGSGLPFTIPEDSPAIASATNDDDDDVADPDEFDKLLNSCNSFLAHKPFLALIVGGVGFVVFYTCGIAIVIKNDFLKIEGS
jgi:hypothetical protein